MRLIDADELKNFIRDMDFISREEVLRFIITCETVGADLTHLYKVVENLPSEPTEAIIEDTPTIDAVPKAQYDELWNNYMELHNHFVDWEPVVMCKDCKYVRVYGDTTKWFWCNRSSGWTIDPNAFCSHGERKEE